MTDLSDVNMEGVKPMNDAQELPIGTYLVRIEDTEKKETKEKYDDAGQKLPPNFYLQIANKVYGGPSEGQTEFSRLNLWNSNQTAVDMAKSELKSIQEATGVVSASSNDLHGKWMVLEVRAGKTEATKDKRYKHYTPATEGMIAAFASVAPVPAKAPAPAATAPAAAPAFVASMPGAAAVAAAPAVVGTGPKDLPSWAKPKA